MCIMLLPICICISHAVALFSGDCRALSPFVRGLLCCVYDQTGTDAAVEIGKYWEQSGDHSNAAPGKKDENI